MKVPEFLNENQRSIFEKMIDGLRNSIGGNGCPSVRRCSNRNELAVWFTQFGVACRDALPPVTA